MTKKSTTSTGTSKITGCQICACFPSPNTPKSHIQNFGGYGKKCPVCGENCGKLSLLDLFCGAGGAARGYQLAGFCVLGIDNKPQPRYAGCRFHQADALQFLSEHGSEFDVIHASPPCQDHIRSYTPHIHGTGHLLADTRDLLSSIDRYWIIENVPGAPMRADFVLCGCMFELPRLQRKRWFETSWHGFALLPPCKHDEHPVSVVGGGIPSKSWYLGKVDGREYNHLAKKAMDIDWMTRKELSQAIPPAYTKFIGGHLANTAILSNKACT